VLPTVLDEFDPQLVIYDVGVDPHSSDSLGFLELSDQHPNTSFATSHLHSVTDAVQMTERSVLHKEPHADMAIRGCAQESDTACGIARARIQIVQVYIIFGKVLGGKEEKELKSRFVSC
jgi:hypothetical protein